MSCGLFSMFDPVCSLPVLGPVGVKWILVVPSLLILPWQLTLLPASSGGLVGKNLVNFMISIVPKSMVIFITTFTVVVMMNLSSLTPLSYAPTAHPGFVLPLSLTLFLPSVIGWLVGSGVRSFVSHLLPTGSPAPLWGFLVLVELVSMSIRPVTLAIRLVANIMAGHIFIEMLTNLLASFPPMIPVGIGLFWGLMMFETAVSIVQALVFTNLLAMFWAEKEESH